MVKMVMPRLWAHQGERGTTEEVPPRGSAGLGGAGALGKFAYNSGREKEVETIYM